MIKNQINNFKEEGWPATRIKNMWKKIDKIMKNMKEKFKMDKCKMKFKIAMKMNKMKKKKKQEMRNRSNQFVLSALSKLNRPQFFNVNINYVQIVLQFNTENHVNWYKKVSYRRVQNAICVECLLHQHKILLKCFFLLEYHKKNLSHNKIKLILSLNRQSNSGNLKTMIPL